MSCNQFNTIEQLTRYRSPSDCGPCDPQYVTRDYCFVACTDVALPFTLPSHLRELAIITDLWLTVVDSPHADMKDVRRGNWSDDSGLFSLKKSLMYIGKCDMCIDGGIYYYEILAVVGNQVQAVQRGRMFVETNYRQKVTECL